MAAFDFPASPTVGQVYTANGVSYQWDGVTWKVLGSNTPIVNGQRVIVYPSAGTFPYVPPADLKALQVELFGSGGGSGGAAVTAATTSSAGGGGGGGSYCRKMYNRADLGPTQDLVIGTGGAGGDGVSTNGQQGTPSSFKGLSVTGGGGGSHGAAATTTAGISRGVPGSSNGGDFNGNGNSGQYGLRNNPAAGYAQSGYGGAGYGKAQYFIAPITTTTVPADVVGSMNNSGANGAANGFSQTLTPGAKGGDGYAIFTEYYYVTDTVSLAITGGGAVTSIGIAPPSSPTAGQLWWDSDSGRLYIYYNDGNTSQWVEAVTSPVDLSSLLRRVSRTVMSASGNYIKPAGLKYVEVELVGTGGNGGLAPTTSAGQAAAGSGGGGGGYCRKLYAASELADSEPVVIGAINGSSGGDGGASTFKGLLAGGGGGGTNGTVSTAVGIVSSGLPGMASGGDLNVPGGRGTNGIRNGVGGAGTASPGSGGGTALAPPGYAIGYLSTTLTGTAGAPYGAGGGGGANGVSQAASASGGFGGLGVAIFTEYF